MAKSIEYGVRKPTSNGFEKRPVERNKGSMPKGINETKSTGVKVVNSTFKK